MQKGFTGTKVDDKAMLFPLQENTVVPKIPTNWPPTSRAQIEW